MTGVYGGAPMQSTPRHNQSTAAGIDRQQGAIFFRMCRWVGTAPARFRVTNTIFARDVNHAGGGGAKVYCAVLIEGDTMKLPVGVSQASSPPDRAAPLSRTI